MARIRPAALKFPEDIREQLARRFRNRHRAWLAASAAGDSPEEAPWPLAVPLGVPTENQAKSRIEEVRAWVAAWRAWRGAGTLTWIDRRWRTLGAHRIPEKLILDSPGEVARWIGEGDRWARAGHRYARLLAVWPILAGELPRHFELLADYPEADFRRLVDVIAWIEANPASDLYPRQLPVAGLDSKWIESRKGPLSDLIGRIRGEAAGGGDFFRCCGLKAPPRLIRLRILDAGLRRLFGGLGDVAAPPEQLARLDIPATDIFIVENLQTGLAFGDLPGSIVIMQLGYGVDVLGRLPWLAGARCVYWGDLDTHGLAILDRARRYLPDLESVLMDEETLLSHRALWTEEKTPHGAESLPLLSDAEQALYRGIRRNVWGRHIRLEQERIGWDVAWPVVRRRVVSGRPKT